MNLPSKLLSLVLSFFVFLILSSKSVLALTEHTYFIHQDHLGSVVAVTDENGNAVTQQSYLPYGQVNTNSSTIGNTVERGYTGQIKDANTTLSYYNARYYDPTLGRFISPDSANDWLGFDFRQKTSLMKTKLPRMLMSHRSWQV